MPRGFPTTEELKAVVIAALMTGMSVSEASRQYKLPKSTVQRLRAELGPETMGQVGTEKRARIDDLLVDLLAANAGALKRYADVTSEPDYIRKQAAADIADLYHEIAGTTLRLLEAASAIQVEAPDDQSGA